jgi:hypothetical protein
MKTLTEVVHFDSIGGDDELYVLPDVNLLNRANKLKLIYFLETLIKSQVEQEQFFDFANRA